MAFGVRLQFSPEAFAVKDCGITNTFKKQEIKGAHLLSISLSSCSLPRDRWVLYVSNRTRKQGCHTLKRKTLTCKCFDVTRAISGNIIVNTAVLALRRSCNSLQTCPFLYRLVPAVGVIAFTLWGLGPIMRLSRKLFFHRNDSNWRKSKTYYILTCYLQPLLFWTSTTLICRALDPVMLPSEASQAIKQRILNFVGSLSTVLAFAFCLSSLIPQAQLFFMKKNDSDDARNMGFQFAGKAVYTAVWVAAVSLFMELLGFSTQKWLTAGGLGTVLLTLAGREIFTNFLSSVMIHATRPFVLNEWIQVRIEGYEVSGTVEHMGWWSPTIIRGDDREAVHIPNHKFSVNVVRNLSQKTHWRIKTHIAISHLDVDKVNNIVADMRKVLAKNPQVEQQKLHRRVFLEDIDPENQALMILISCFVKTSHFEEYLCVKEAVLLDLLRIVRHHRARLATPIRMFQKMYGDGDMENTAFADTIFSRAATSSSRPFLLVESPTRINGEERNKVRQPLDLGEEQAAKIATSNSRMTTSGPDGLLNGNHAESGAELADKKEDGASLQAKPENARFQVPPAVSSRTTLEENIVLGVALDGAKRTLPIEDDMDSSSITIDPKELASLHSAGVGMSPTSANDKKDGHNPAAADQREQER